MSCLSLPVPADTVDVVLHGPYVESVTSGGATILAVDLSAGSSTGAADHLNLGGFPVLAADDRNLETYFVRTSVADPTWRVELEEWTDSNGPEHDFFVFELGGNDSLTVSAELVGGGVGLPVALTGWTATTFVPDTGSNAGQVAHALAFGRSDLLDANGAPLEVGASLAALVFESASIDGAACLVHSPIGEWGQAGDGSVVLTGNQRVGQLTEITYRGPMACETDVDPNPFFDYRLDVELQGPGGELLRLPGFFDADGKKGERGTIWRARFRPTAPGTWTAIARFREGPAVATSLDPFAGSPGSLDGVTVAFKVKPLLPAAEGFRATGRFELVGGGYRRAADGSYLLRVGPNSPENILAYQGFDAVTKRTSGGGLIHAFAPHVMDWRPGDPLFESQDRGVDARGLIGALNYISGVGMNSITAFLMTLGGDGEDVHPFLGARPDPFDRTHYDTSRLRQWHQVFQHATSRGLALHLFLAETETGNWTWLDDGALGPERKVFFREMVARFAHHPALLWNLSEENVFPLETLRDMADHLLALDPYGNPIVFHNYPSELDDYLAVLGEPRFAGAMLQFFPNFVSGQLDDLRLLSAATGHDWLLGGIEHSPAEEGATDSNHDELRKKITWDVLLSSGHLEWYMGYHPLPLGGDLSVEDFRTRETVWQQTRYAHRLVTRAPFWEMSPSDDLLTGEAGLLGGGEVFAKADEVYLCFLPAATGTPLLDLTGADGALEQRWFDPRTGTFASPAIPVVSGAPWLLGPAPHSPSEDWVVVIARPGADVLN